MHAHAAYRRHHGSRVFGILCAMMMLAVGCGRAPAEDRPLRMGYFPNLTHAQALIGLARRDFQRALGDEVVLEPVVFNAGPSVIEALFAGEIDLAYIGSNPAINGYVKSRGQALRVIAGAASGGAVLVARADSGVATVSDLPGKLVATPQLGNTQDIALRYYLKQRGLAPEEKGGTVKVIPMQNADILSGFLRREIDAAWVPEPWGARLVHEAGGRVLLDERELWPSGTFPTALIIANTQTLAERPELIRRWLQAHVAVTQWMVTHPQEARQAVNTQLQLLTGKAIAAPVLEEAWSRLQFTHDPLVQELYAAAEHAFAVGFLGQTMPELSQLVDLGLLNSVLKEQGLPTAAD